jgi:spore maturation protein CgeB
MNPIGEVTLELPNIKNGMTCPPGARCSLKIVILGLSITSSWGNGHATTYRGLVRELVRRGHQVLFLERDAEWYASNRDLPKPPYGSTQLYTSLRDLQERFTNAIREAHLVIVGSYVPQGIAIGQWILRMAEGVTAFYDIDTPVTLARLARGEADYISIDLIRHYDLYLSFTGGPTLTQIEEDFGSPSARPLYCSVDTHLYFPERLPISWSLGYMGTYSDDRQPALNKLLVEPARQLPNMHFVIAGPQYPKTIQWPPNIERIEHLSPREHRSFYNTQSFTLNITRADMVKAGYSPSVRLFEAAACGTPIISDYWTGLETFFRLNEEILVARSSGDVIRILNEIGPVERNKMAERARARVLGSHTAAHRAAELEAYAFELIKPASSNATL